MFRELIQAFRRKDTVGAMIERFGEMLDDGQWMFATAGSVVHKEQAPEEVQAELYRRDRKINRLEYRIRQNILVHLAMGNMQDVSMCLVLMSVAKDAERIGDYCKNLFEIGQYFRSRYGRSEYAEPLGEVRRTILDAFPTVRDAFLKGDADTAQQVRERLTRTRHRCDLLIQQLLSPGFPGEADEAVAYALRSRFLKRVNSHLANIATSVTNPVPMLDFRDQTPADEEEDA
jgi:phosphate uptake regulator